MLNNEINAFDEYIVYMKHKKEFEFQKEKDLLKEV